MGLPHAALQGASQSLRGSLMAFSEALREQKPAKEEFSQSNVLAPARRQKVDVANRSKVTCVKGGGV